MIRSRPRSIRSPVHAGLRVLAALLLVAMVGLPLAGAAGASPTSDQYIRDVDALSALWSYYRHTYLHDGRVVSLDEDGITTSEGQGYALLRAVWANDHRTFEAVWNWTVRHLQVRGDHLFAWKWKGRPLSLNTASDADTDIALALILAARRFAAPGYQTAAQAILEDIWQREVRQVGDEYYLTAGNWAKPERHPTIHVAYLAPYAYEVFAGIDSRHPWPRLVQSSYKVLHWLYDEQHLPVPPEVVFLDPSSGALRLADPKTGAVANFSYDAFPLFWRLAVDAQWFGRAEQPLRQKMLAFFEQEWRRQGRLLDRYSLEGQPLSHLEAWPLYATVHALAWQEQHHLARVLEEAKLAGLRSRGMAGDGIPYYAHNWLWFDRAFELQLVRTFDEFLGFLRPFDVQGFALHFPWALVAVTLTLYLLAPLHRWLTLAFLLSGTVVAGQYLGWRLTETLNVLEPAGPLLSGALWLAECYAFSTVLLLLVQVGLGRSGASPRSMTSNAYRPSVDVFIPIYTESCEILERTLIAATAMDYVSFQVHVLDDGHREEVAQLAIRYGARYMKGPRRHAKAGNLNHALRQTTGELVVVFDTDHIPVRTFLAETVPCFADSSVGFVQTPHHFYNPDIFQRAFFTGPGLPNEQDMFNHAIQAGRSGWNGTIFVGSGAVFRRAAIMQIGGFQLLSITEDIHTSQHLHAAGWRSVFVDQDLAVGLTAENLSSYIVQRRRWMLGCLQIFFKDNPLLCRGLTLRQRLGYFASLYYFFFPLARVVFWAAPLAYLLFHLHPIFSDVSVLVAHLLPFMIVLPLMSSRLLPGWPRLLWSSVYEMTVSFALGRSMLDLLLPKHLGFHVTPKGLVSERRSFDWASSKALLVATAITVVAIAKGSWEFWYFGIEKDAYFFNLAWASFNLLFLLAGLLVAWEPPQRRAADRLRTRWPLELQAGEVRASGMTIDISLSGCSARVTAPQPLPAAVELTLHASIPIRVHARLVHQTVTAAGEFHCGLAFAALSAAERRQLVLDLFADPGTWAESHALRTRSSVGMAWQLLAGLCRACRPYPKSGPRSLQPSDAYQHPVPLSATRSPTDS